ncbi:hypothetical protein RRG08_025700 [Elysia crispata]|uniref:Uncharacterized protein n=1 Tax=Elysia crispata TaxID=231223 RepID=A0AAE1AXT5_9GAST|nr:hypothetical protein RRG08_025700 [Elysia crispata]
MSLPLKWAYLGNNNYQHNYHQRDNICCRRCCGYYPRQVRVQQVTRVSGVSSTDPNPSKLRRRTSDYQSFMVTALFWSHLSISSPGFMESYQLHAIICWEPGGCQTNQRKDVLDRLDVSL